MSLFEKICKVFYNNKTLIQGVKMIKNKVVLGSLLAFSLLGAKDINIQDSQDKTKTDLQTNMEVKEIKTTTPLETEKKTKTGILVGVELGLGGGSGKEQHRIDQVIPQEGVIPSDVYNSIIPFDFNAKIFGGYQKYFGENETFGFNVKGSLGTGFLNYNLKNLYSVDANGERYEADSSFNADFNYIPLSVGIEANFLYDFFQKAEHTVGLNVGLGYSFVYGVNASMKISDDSTADDNSDFLMSFGDRNIYYSLISPKIGIHYYYGRHQVEFNFSFDKAFGETKNVNSLYDGSFGEEIVTIKTRPDYFYTFNLSYAYRF